MVSKIVTLQNETFSIQLNDRLQLKKSYCKPLRDKTFSQLGIWIDGQFKWIHEDDWDSRMYMHSNSNVVYTVLHNKKHSICLQLEETMDSQKPIFYRKITVINQSIINRRIRLYFFQNVSNKNSGGQDTVFFAPKEKVMLHYQSNLCWLFNGDFGNEGVKQYSTFSQIKELEIEKHGLNEKSGKLFFNPIAKGNVTSVFSLENSLLPYERKEGFYWFMYGQTKEELIERNQQIMEKGPKKMIQSLMLGNGEIDSKHDNDSEEKVILIR